MVLNAVLGKKSYGSTPASSGKDFVHWRLVEASPGEPAFG